MFEVISFFTYQTKCLLLRPREVMHGLLTYSVKQLKASLFFLLTGSDTQHENVATAGGLMWFMVPGSRLVFRCEPVLHWSSSKPKPLGVLLIGSNIGESFWTFTALAQVASGLQKASVFFSATSLSSSVSHTLTHKTRLATHTSSHAFPCSSPGLVPPYFLSWLQAVSFFRSCIYPPGTLTSFEQRLINSISNSVPPKNLFSLYRQNIVSLRCCLVSPHDIYFKRENLPERVTPIVRVLFDFLSGYNLSQLKRLIQ